MIPQTQHLILAALAVGSWGSAYGAPILNTTDFISSPAYSNGFESIPSVGFHYIGGAGPYIEGGLAVAQINGDAGNDIWATIAQTYPFEGRYAWYPDGGDFGYTQITRADGSDFSDISMIFRAWGFGNVLYDLLDDGISVLSGGYAYPNEALGRIGFQGGGFDEVRLRSGVLGSNFYDGGLNALGLDSIKSGTQSVPEPASLALLGIGLAGIGAMRHRTLAK